MKLVLYCTLVLSVCSKKDKLERKKDQQDSPF